jgi:hypothetical protein
MRSRGVNQPEAPESGDPASDVERELLHVRAERDAAMARLDDRARRKARGSAMRRWAVAVLVILTAILIPITITATWAHRTVLNTDAFVRTMTPVATDPAVTAALGRIATDQIFKALNPEPTIAASLPPRTAFLAGPITNGVKDYVQARATTALNSQRFEQIWVTANRTAHKALVNVLKGDSKAVVTTNGQVVLSIVPLLNQVLISVQQSASGLIGKDVTLPQLTGTELPSAACAKISAALNRPLPPTCGQIPLFPASKLDQAQWAVQAFDRAVVVLLIITPLIALAALALSRRRRRTLLQMFVGAILVLVVVRRAMMWLQDTLIDTGRPENKAARSAIVHDLLRGFFTVSAWALGIGLAVVLVAMVTGPYGWAVRLRGWIRTGAEATVEVTKGAYGRGADASAGVWLRGHLDLMRVAGIALAVLLLLVFDVSFIGLLTILALLAAYQLWLHRVASAQPPSSGLTPSG